VISRSEAKSRAAILDVASASPQGAAKLVPCPRSELSGADLVVLTAGATPETVPDRSELHAVNRAITQEILTETRLAPTTMLIVMATPVDDIAPLARRISGLPSPQVIGFGGDLDCNRLAAVLRAHGISAEGVHVVGEHGRKGIPVYPGEQAYETVADQTRSYLSTIIKLSGPPRNLATSVLLDKLITSIASDASRQHHVCGFHQELGVFLTWPFTVGRQGLLAPGSVRLGPKAQAAFDVLLEERRRKRAQLEVDQPLGP
jgi:malate/lactate dehydrogenase